jgi:hypothetical protein
MNIGSTAGPPSASVTSSVGKTSQCMQKYFFNIIIVYYELYNYYFETIAAKGFLTKQFSVELRPSFDESKTF